MKPTKNNLIIKPISKEEATKNGIIVTLEQHTDTYMRYGIIESLGIAVNDDVVSHQRLKEGDRIAYYGNEAVDIEAHGTPYHIINKDAVVLLD